MSEEEKKAIEQVNYIIEEVRENTKEETPTYIFDRDIKCLPILLNLIEKQQKEIKFQKRKEELINRVIKGYDNNAIDADTAIEIYKINLRDLSLGILEE